MATGADAPGLESPPVLGVTPPHWAGRLLAWGLIVAAAATAVASVVIRVPETVSGPFVLVPVRGADPVRAARAGVVAAVRAGEGQTVARDEALVVIQSPAIGDRRAELAALEAQLAGAGEGLANARYRHDGQRRASDEEASRLAQQLAHVAVKAAEHESLRVVRGRRYREERRIVENDVEIAKKELEFKTTHHRLARELAERSERLYAQGMVSWLEHSTRALEAQKLAVDLQQLERQLDSSRRRVTQLRAEHERETIEASLAQAGLEAERRDTRAAIEKVRHESRVREVEGRELERRLLEDAEKARIRAAALGAELTPGRGGDLAAAAPCAGVVLRLHVKAPGAVVQQGDLLAEVACDGGRLHAEVAVPPDGVGRIQPAQGAKLLYEAFPYQRFGARLGTVRWMTPAGVGERDGVAFRALVDIEDESVVVKGRPQPLRAGMRGRAQVVVGRRSLVSFAFEPIHQLRESLRDAPGR